MKRNAGTRKLEKYYHLVGWGVPCIAVIIVSAFKKYGLTRLVNGSCYITESIFIFATFFLPGFILVCINSVLFFFVASEIHGTLSKAPEAEQRESSKEFRVLMSIFVTVGLSWLFAFLYAILATVEVLNIILLVLMTLITPLQGFFIFVAYCLNKKVRRKWQFLLGRVFPFCLPEGGMFICLLFFAPVASSSHRLYCRRHQDWCYRHDEYPWWWLHELSGPRKRHQLCWRRRALLLFHVVAPLNRGPTDASFSLRLDFEELPVLIDSCICIRFRRVHIE